MPALNVMTPEMCAKIRMQLIVYVIDCLCHVVYARCRQKLRMIVVAFYLSIVFNFNLFALYSYLSTNLPKFH